MFHISIDIETFSSAPNAALASIGAVAWKERFNLADLAPSDRFVIGVLDRTGHFDPDTIRWHAKQDRPGITTGAELNIVPAAKALVMFAEWLNIYGAQTGGEACLWTHATFDIPVLASAYRRYEIKEPWHYRNCKDLRTLYMLAGGRPKEPDGSPENLIAHSAIDDAIYQAYEVEHCLSRITSK